MTVSSGPHDFRRKGWRLWLCRHCYAPRAAHPMHGWVRARPLGDNRYVSFSRLAFDDLSVPPPKDSPRG